MIDWRRQSSSDDDEDDDAGIVEAGVCLVLSVSICL